jgi:group I intron endonuclease
MTRLQLFFSTIEQWTGNLHLAEIQKITNKELKNKSGIYGFVCKTTGKLYIGSSIDLSDRFSNHINGSKSNVKLQNAINKYNLHDFIFIVFEYCESMDLISREQFYIDGLKPEYNILKVAGSSLGYKHTEETLALISKALSGEKHPLFGKTGENSPRYGQTHSADTLIKMSENRSGENHPQFGKTGEKSHNYGRTHSAQTKALMSVVKSGDNNPMSKKVFVYLLDPETKEARLSLSFNTCLGAAEYFKCSNVTISNYLDKNKLYKKQWILSSSKKKES